LSLNPATGALAGTPTTPGTSTFTIAAAAGTCTGAQTYTMVVVCPTISITTASLPSGVSGTGYSQQVNVSPAGSYTFAVVQGSLPAGMTLNQSTGLISGTAQTPGTHNFTVKAQLGNGCSTTQVLSITIICPTVTLSPSTLPNGQMGTVYSQMLSAAPAGGGYTFTRSGNLPPGLSLNALTGLLSGTPTANGSFSFVVTATGSYGCSGSQSYTVIITPGSCPTITLSTLPNGKKGTLYVQYVVASPASSYSYSLTGTLPAGLTFYPAIGLIFGYPTAAESYNFSVTATNLNNCSGTRAYDVAIAP